MLFARDAVCYSSVSWSILIKAGERSEEWANVYNLTKTITGEFLIADQG